AVAATRRVLLEPVRPRGGGRGPRVRVLRPVRVLERLRVRAEQLRVRHDDGFVVADRRRGVLAHALAAILQRLVPVQLLPRHAERRALPDSVQAHGGRHRSRARVPPLRAGLPFHHLLVAVAPPGRDAWTPRVGPGGSDAGHRGHAGDDQSHAHRARRNRSAGRGAGDHPHHRGVRRATSPPRGCHSELRRGVRAGAHLRQRCQQSSPEDSQPEARYQVAAADAAARGLTMPIGYRDRHGRRPRQPLTLPRPPRDADNAELLSYVDRLATSMQEWARDLLERVEESRAVAHRRWDTNSAAFSATSITDMAIHDVPLKGGTLYGVHLAAQIGGQGTVASNERWLV